MTHLVLSTDASVVEDGEAGIGYAVERVGDDGEQVEMLVKDCDDVSFEDDYKHSETVHEAEYVAVVRGAKEALEHLDDDERLVVRSDSRYTVERIENGADEFRSVVEGIEVEVREIPRTLNSVADSLSKQASRDKVR